MRRFENKQTNQIKLAKDAARWLKLGGGRWGLSSSSFLLGYVDVSNVLGLCNNIDGIDQARWGSFRNSFLLCPLDGSFGDRGSSVIGDTLLSSLFDNPLCGNLIGHLVLDMCLISSLFGLMCFFGNCGLRSHRLCRFKSVLRGLGGLRGSGISFFLGLFFHIFHNDYWIMLCGMQSGSVSFLNRLHNDWTQWRHIRVFCRDALGDSSRLFP